jgi:hypothetical protein
VQNVSVADGGKAIVGNVTQHANVIVSDKNPASAAADARKGPPDLSEHKRDAVKSRRKAQG